VGATAGRLVRRQVDLAQARVEDVAALLAGSDVLVHLARSTQDPDDELAQLRDRRALLTALEAAAHAGVGHVVAVSSALVYGAWANNPVPLPESAPLRPNPGFSFAVQAAELERVVGDWATEEHRRVTLLRPAPAVAEQNSSWIGRAMQGAARIRVGAGDPPVQFLHVDDLASAVVVAVTAGLSGAYNVAPDGWLSGEDLRALQGARPRLWLPEPLAERLAVLRSRRARRPMPAELLPYTMNPCVVANDRLRAEGWSPDLSNEEAYVASDDAPPWAAMNARQRQVISLTALGLATAAVVMAVVLVGRRLHRRARR
jgi:nucleoside-diphosphate-sugar epimerase